MTVTNAGAWQLGMTALRANAAGVVHIPHSEDHGWWSLAHLISWYESASLSTPSGWRELTVTADVWPANTVLNTLLKSARMDTPLRLS
jgi:hypothetical protein